MTFRVGQKVVCVDDAFTDAEGERELVHAAVYTVRWAGIYENDWFGPEYCVRLVGIDRGVDPWVRNNIDCPFRSSRFRSIVEHKTDISVFIEMLTKTGVDA